MIRGKRDWQRVSKRRPCPVCEKPDWCLYAGPDDSPEAAICARVESPKRCGEAGWLHRLRDDGPMWPPWQRTMRRAVKMMAEGKPAGIDFDRLAAECQAAVKPETFGRLADDLGLSVESLQRLSAGWSSEHGAWTFPMVGTGGRVVGIRLRLAGGRKLAIRGGREGLFLPAGIDPGGRLLVCEGPTDCAALLDLGFHAVGRPSCRGGVAHLVALVNRLWPADLVIVADADGPGQRGADALAAKLAAYVQAVRVITPPRGLKDARVWKRAGATRGDVQAAINAAEPRRLPVIVKGR